MTPSGMTLQHLLDELPAVIAVAPSDSLGPVIIQLAACQSAVAVRLLNGHQHGAVERRMSPIENGVLLTIAQVANQLNVKKSYVYELVRQQKLASVRLGKHVRVAQDTLAKYIATATSSA